MEGSYFAIVGGDFTGTTTQKDLLVERVAVEYPDIPVHGVHEPGSTALGEELYRITRDRSLDIDSLAMLHLFTAARIQIWEKEVKPVLNQGGVVVSDRNWWCSSAYQGAWSGIDADRIYDVTAEALPDEYVYPEHVFVLSLNSDLTRERAIARGGYDSDDTFEYHGESLNNVVAAEYKRLATNFDNSDGASIIDGSGSKEDVHERIWSIASNYIKA